MKKIIFVLLLALAGFKLYAHPMPGSSVELFIMNSYIRGEAKIPLIELGYAVGDQRITNLQDPFFKSYFKEHIRAANEDKYWLTTINDIAVITGYDPVIGTYKEAVVHFTLKPTNENKLRNFTFHYDAVIHQVVTHSAIISIKQDWKNGLLSEGEMLEIGVIKLDIPSGKIYPLEISLEKGSQWKGFKQMFILGTKHIKDGTDHLLFLIVLLLPALLTVKGKYWGQCRSTKSSLTALVKIVTAFTIGHSLTLLLGAFGWLSLPQQPVEILIAFSILVSAINALYPIFPRKETYVAAGFGLVHGLAFATILSNLDLDSRTLALSVLGFNLGIELMQLIIIAMIIPWFILLSKTPFYKAFRISIAILAAIAAIAWIVERTAGKENFITAMTAKIPMYGLWCIFTVALISLLGYYFSKFFNSRN